MWFWAPRVAEIQKMIAVKKVIKVENRLEKLPFCLPFEGCKISFFFLPPISSRTGWCHIKYSSCRMAYFCRDEFHQESRHFRGLNFGERKRWMLTCYRRGQKVRILYWSPLRENCLFCAINWKSSSPKLIREQSILAVRIAKFGRC